MKLQQLSKTTWVSYILAALLATQPFMDTAVDFSKRGEVIKYMLKLVLAVAIALLGKYAADKEAKLLKRRTRYRKEELHQSSQGYSQ